MNFARDFSVSFCIHLFSHNLCVMNSNLSDNVLYLEAFTIELAKHKMATKKRDLLVLEKIYETHYCGIINPGDL